MPLCRWCTDGYFEGSVLTSDQGVGGSSPSGCTNKNKGLGPVFKPALLLWQELCGTLWRRFSPSCRSDAIGVSYEEPMEVAVRFSARQALFESEIRKSLPDWPEQVI